MGWVLPTNMTSFTDFVIWQNDVTGGLFWPAALITLIATIFISIISRGRAPEVGFAYATWIGFIIAIPMNILKLISARGTLFFIGLFLVALLWLAFARGDND